MIKEKLPDPSIAIAPTEAGTQLKGTAVGSEKGKALLDFGKNNLQKLAVIGCGPKAARTGGRIGLNEGQNLQTCALRGIEKLKGDQRTNFSNSRASKLKKKQSNPLSPKESYKSSTMKQRPITANQNQKLEKLVKIAYGSSENIMQNP